jgi:hypothetical protein
LIMYCAKPVCFVTVSHFCSCLLFESKAGA